MYIPIKKQPQPRRRKILIPKHWEYLSVSRRLKDLAIAHEANKPLLYETYSTWGIPLLQ